MTAISFWQASAPPGPVRPALDGVHEADIAIVGGGIAGLSLAHHLAAEGRAPILLEASEPGSGALGASAGIIAPQLVRDTPSGVIAKLGREPGANWLRLIAESGAHLFGLIAQEAIDCDARPFGFIAPAAGRAGLARLHRSRDEWLPFRRDLRVIDRAETAALTGCRGYDGAIVDESGGALDPLRLARGLAARAEAQGARIFHHSRVTVLERRDRGWRIATERGEVRAAQVVLCANGGNGDLHPMLQQTVLPLRIYEMATTPLPPMMRARVLPGGHCMTDVELDIFSIRYAEGGRLVTAFPIVDGDLELVEALVNARLLRMLTDFQPIRIAHLWEGTAWVNSSLLPRLVRVDEGLVAVQACNGRGIATNAIVGRELARMYLSDGAYQPMLLVEGTRPIRGFALAQRLPRLIMSGALTLKRLRAAIGGTGSRG